MFRDKSLNIDFKILISEISTGVVHLLPKQKAPVRFRYLALIYFYINKYEFLYTYLWL